MGVSSREIGEDGDPCGRVVRGELDNTPSGACRLNQSGNASSLADVGGEDE